MKPTRETLLVLALQACTDEAALPVLGDAVTEAGWGDWRIEATLPPRWKHGNVVPHAANPSTEWARSVAVVLLEGLDRNGTKLRGAEWAAALAMEGVGVDVITSLAHADERIRGTTRKARDVPIGYSAWWKSKGPSVYEGNRLPLQTHDPRAFNNTPKSMRVKLRPWER